MCKKFFHPNNIDNIKRKYMADEADKHKKEKDAELMAKYLREQEDIDRKILMGDKKAKYGLSWMYDEPINDQTADDKDVSDKKKLVKFEWQRKYNAPRESYCKNNADIIDQPFGIEVRHIRCMKCSEWGHSIGDQICPRFYESITLEPDYDSNKVSVKRALKGSIKDLKSNDGLTFTESAVSTGFNAIMQQDRKRRRMSHSSSENDESDSNNDDSKKRKRSSKKSHTKSKKHHKEIDFSRYPHLNREAVAFLKTVPRKEQKRLLKKMGKSSSSGSTSFEDRTSKDRHHYNNDCHHHHQHHHNHSSQHHRS